MIVVVTGGRAYHNNIIVYRVLDDIHAVTPITLLVEGGSTGADRLAECWAISRGVKWRREQADWSRYGNHAGPVRNQSMLDKYKPELGLIFPGGAGTADMTARMKLVANANLSAEVLVAISPGVFKIALRVVAEERKNA